MPIEKVATVGLKTPEVSLTQFQNLMNELEKLVETAGGHVAHQFSQAKPHPDPATFFGRGKIKEIADALPHISAKTLVINDELSPAHHKNIEKLVPPKVVYR